VVLRFALWAPRWMRWIAPMSIARTSLLARFREPSAASSDLPIPETEPLHEILSTDEFLLMIDGIDENHDPLRVCAFSCKCRAWIGADVMCRVNLSRLSVRNCCFGFWPLAKTRVTCIPCCRAAGTSTRFKARLNLDLCARLVVPWLLWTACVAAAVDDDEFAFPALRPRINEARDEGGRGSVVPTEEERPRTAGFIAIARFRNSIRFNDAMRCKLKA
jgi:hypothetical protein